MNIQIQLEDCFYNLAVLFKGTTVILCDRGLMDGQAYTRPYLWKKILTENNMNEAMIRDQRYDAVLHMVTAADGAQKFYGFGNQARYESIEDAISIDQKLQYAWLGHPKHEILDNYTVKDFEDKLETLLQKVKRIIGIQAEKKMVNVRFLIDHDISKGLGPKVPDNIKCINCFIEDNYILFEHDPQKGGQSIRVRRRVQHS